jgi:hypothetical protein
MDFFFILLEETQQLDQQSSLNQERKLQAKFYNKENMVKTCYMG